MIVFQTDTNYKIDFSKFGVSVTEESSLFNNSMTRSYSIPFSMPLEDELVEKLGLPQIENITNVKTSIKGKLLLPYHYYNATLYLGEIKGTEIQCDLTFGDHDLAVYDLPLKDLPWPIQVVPNYVNLINSTIIKNWPQVAYNFPKIYRPAIKEESGYESFQGFVNNHTGFAPVFNSVDNSGAEPVYHNYNVFAPFPYLLEIIRFIYKQEGIAITGELLEDPMIKRVLYMPEKYLEKFRGSEYTSHSFDLPTEVQNEFSVYEKSFIPTRAGTYELDLKLNFDPVIAQYFEIKITYQDPETSEIKTLFEALSEENRVSISEKISINIEASNQYGPVNIMLKLKNRTESIKEFNQFEYSYKGGRLNEFPSSFNLADFMPDMKAGEFMNMIKNWLNLDIQIKDGTARLDFTQNSILRRHREKHEHLQDPDKSFTHNSNRFYKLTYANGQTLYYNRNGRVYSDISEEGSEIITIDMEVQPAVVEMNKDVMTAVMPPEASKFDFCLYERTGDISYNPVCSPEFSEALSLDNNVRSRWLDWLRYRVHSKSFKDSFDCSVHERIDINELSYKYNELHVFKKLQKKYLSNEIMRVDIESETF